MKPVVPRGSAPFTIAPPGFRLPPELRLGVVRLEVADLARSLAYYETVIGLRVLAREGSVARLAAQPDSRALVELRERPGATPVPRRGRLGLYHFAILLPDRATLGSFLAHLSGIGAHPGMSDHLVSEALYLSDPDGLGIEVYADRPRSSWRLEGDGIAMATDPLDAAGVLQAGQGRHWEGMPAGTRIGHVHLHVGDLARAEAFYHAGLGLEKVVLNFPGALFLSAGGYHHHLGTNTWAAGAPRAGEGDARLLEWTVELPASRDVEAAAVSLAGGGFEVARDGGEAIAADPWSTVVRIRAGGVALA
jgi:catechol 2,3-dioxygenase